MSPGRDRTRTDDLRRERSARRRAERRQRSLLSALLLAVALLVGLGLLQGLHLVAGALEQPTTDAGFYTSKVAVVGVTDRTVPDRTDRDVLGEQPAQVGAVLTGGDCAASGWATLSAGREVSIDCTPEVTDLGVVNDWRDRQAEAARTGGELGTLAASGQQCITAVGPGAAIGAARPDGTTAEYLDVAGYVDSGFTSSCAVTFVDAGDRSSEVIRGLASQDDVTVIVVGVGGVADAQLAYRIGTTLPGWLTSDSTDRAGVVTLPDLTRTLQQVVAGGPVDPAGTGVTGKPLQVIENSGVPTPRLTDHVAAVDALVGPAYGPILVLAAVAVVIALLGAAWWWQGSRHGTPGTALHRLAGRVPYGLGLLAATAPVALLVAGVTPWWRSSSPGSTAVGSALLAWLLVAALVALSWRVGPLARRGLAGWPAAVVLTLVVCLADAAVGGYLQHRSLLAVRPMRHFSGFDGPTMGLLVASGVALLGVVVAGSSLLHRLTAGPQDAASADDESGEDGASGRATAADTRPRRRMPLPFQVMWRPLVVVAVGVAVVLAVRWAAHPMTAADVIGFGVMVLWFLGAGVWLHRLGAPGGAVTGALDEEH